MPTLTPTPSPFTAPADAPATRADLAAFDGGMQLLPGEGVPGFSTPPLRPRFAPALMPDWHAVHSPDYAAVRWVEPVPDAANADANSNSISSAMRERAVDWKTLARWQRTAAAYIARAMGIAAGDEGRYWACSSSSGSDGDSSALLPGLRGELMAPVVAFVAAGGDALTYRLLSAGCERLGLVPLLVSANNSAAAIAHLLAACNAQAVLTGPKGASPPLEAKLKQALDTLREGKTEVSRAGAQPRIIEWPADFGALFPFDDGASASASASAQYAPLPLATPWAPFDLDRPLAILHSSGTTSLFPKPIVIRQRHVQAIALGPLCAFPADAAPAPALAAEGGARRMQGGLREATLLGGHLPPAHAMGFFIERHASYTSAAAGYLSPPGAPQKPVTPLGVLEAAQHFENVELILPPALLEGIAKDERLLKLMKRWRTVAYGGGPLPAAAYEKLRSEGVRAISILGSTEAGIQTRWWYDGTSNDDPFPPGMHGAMEVTPMANCHFRKLGPDERVGEQDEYELIVTARGPFSAPAVINAEWQGKPAYACGDRARLLPPGKSGQPRFVLLGRIDPGIVLSTGEKTNPQPMVAEVEKSDAVAEALMFGQARQFNGILVRPSATYGTVDTNDDAQVARFRNEIWPFVEKANAVAPSHSAIYKEMILVASEDKPFEYTAKGSLRNGATLELYKPDIDRIYALFEGASTSNIPAPSSWSDERAVRDFTCAVVAEALRMRPEQIAPADDLFQQLGADSLVATKVRNVLLSALAQEKGKESGVRLPGNFVYANPSVEALAAALVQVAASGSAEGGAGPASDRQRMQVLQPLIDKYTAEWPQRTGAQQNGLANGHANGHVNGHANGHANGYSNGHHGGHVFVVTGTTGGAGAHFLAQLARRPDVRKVYAINRTARDGTSLLQRQQDALRLRGEPQDVATDAKVELLEADTADQEHLGLPQHKYDEIKNSVTHIIHNAWRLDFNIGVKSFEAQIASVRSFALLALRSPRPQAPRLLFMSSVGTTSNWKEQRPVPEEPLDPLVAGGGYGEAKAVAEKILESVRRERGLEAVTIRAGQLSGSTTNGSWATTDWVPMLYKSALSLRCLPTHPGGICWVPTDVVTATVIDFALAEEKLPFALHLVNPRTSPWAKMISAVASFLQGSSAEPIKLVSPQEWADALKAQAQAASGDMTTVAFESNPALKLADFFAAMAAGQTAQDGVPREAFGPTRLETSKAEHLSPTLRNCAPVSAEDVHSWLRWWQQQGFLPAEGGKA